MQYTPLFLLTFALLIFSILSVWLRPTTGKRATAAPVDMILLLLAVLTGMLGGYLTVVGAGVIGGFVAVALMATRPGASPTKKVLLTSVTVILALLLAMHALPGFHNVRLLDNIKLSADASPYTLYANFDKAAVGLVLVAFFCKRTASWTEFFGTLKKAMPIILVTIIGVMGAAVALGTVTPDFKIPASILVFSVVNLFFTCVAEEAFFRGLLQEKLSSKLLNKQHGEIITVVCSAVLFGAVHAGAGIAYMALAALAGLGYACIYSATKRVEAPIVAHFLLNLTHFVCFTYPSLV